MSAREFGGADTWATSNTLTAAIEKIGVDKGPRMDTSFSQVALSAPSSMVPAPFTGGEKDLYTWVGYFVSSGTA